LACTPTPSEHNLDGNTLYRHLKLKSTDWLVAPRKVVGDRIRCEFHNQGHGLLAECLRSRSFSVSAFQTLICTHRQGGFCAQPETSCGSGAEPWLDFQGVESSPCLEDAPMFQCDVGVIAIPSGLVVLSQYQCMCKYCLWCASLFLIKCC
jgi:hypothetical protein